MTTRSRRIDGALTTIALLIAAVPAAGCSEDVNPVLGTDRAFTVYGYFDARADTQAMRVFAIEGRLEMTRPEPLDARVVSLDLQAGDRHAWRDSVVQFPSGRFGHVYWAPFRAAYERRYRLELTRSDGAVTRAEVVMPPLSEPALLTPTVADRFVLIPVLWRRAPRLNNIRVRYYTSCGVFEYSYPLDQERVDAGAIVTIRLSTDALAIFQDIFNTGCTYRELRLEEVELRVLVTGAEWVSPIGVFDADLLVEPGTFTNVENGFGFVGAGYEASFRWAPPDSVATAAGFLVGEVDDGGTTGRVEG